MEGRLHSIQEAYYRGCGAIHFQGDVCRLDSWQIMLLRALPKNINAKKTDGHRMIALSSTLCEWLLRAVITLILFERSDQRARGSHTESFTLGRSTSSVIVCTGARMYHTGQNDYRQFFFF